MELQKQNSCCSARRDSETEERKKVLNRCFSTFVHFQTRQSCTLVCICSSFIFYAPLRLSFGRYCSLCEENEMSKVRCKSKSPLSRLAWWVSARCWVLPSGWDLPPFFIQSKEPGSVSRDFGITFLGSQVRDLFIWWFTVYFAFFWIYVVKG